MKPQLKLSNQICHRFYVVNNAITRAYKPYLDELGITYPQYLVLMALWEQDEVEVGYIQSVTQIDSGALTLIMKKLMQKDIISMAAAEHDKRVKIVKLTAKGWKLESQASEIPYKLKCQFPEVSEQEIIQLQQLLDKLNISLAGSEKG